VPIVTSQDGVIDDESLVKTRTNTCLSETSAVPSYSVPQLFNYILLKHGLYFIQLVENYTHVVRKIASNSCKLQIKSLGLVILVAKN
jgi:hypothetical protein